MPSLSPFATPTSVRTNPASAAGFLDRTKHRNMTMLVVDDSRFASDALRLICQRLGLRMRRADSIEAARSHLRTYLPDILVVDLGLPDGHGAELIRQTLQSPVHPALILGTSGCDDGHQQSLLAGADGFLAKPVESVASLARLIARLCPDMAFGFRQAEGDRSDRDQPVRPDPLAYRDDLTQMAELLANTDGTARFTSYIAPFLAGVADCAHDAQITRASRDAQALGGKVAGSDLVGDLTRLIQQRLRASEADLILSGRH